jgi:hypothetical protein
MRLVLAMVFAGLMALPLSVGAQAGEEHATSEPAPEEPEPSTEPTPEEPALELKLDDAGVEVVPSPPRTAKGYTLEEMELRVKRAKIGLIAPAVVAVSGVAPLVLGTTGDCSGWPNIDSCRRLRISGVTLTIAGALGVIATSILVGVRKDALKMAAGDYTPEEVRLRVKRTNIGAGVSAAALGLGPVLLLVGTLSSDCFVILADPGYVYPTYCDVLPAVGGTLIVGGLVGLVASTVLNIRVQGRRSWKKRWQRPWWRRGEHHGTPRRVQWDLARSRLVF